MRISLYTAMRNCVQNDYPFIEMLRHHLPLVDEIIVNEGFSEDGTYEALQTVDPKVRVFRTVWPKASGEDWWIHFKDAARRQCSGDWCIHLDSDEFIPEWEFTGIRAHLASTDEVMVPVRFFNFWGNYRVFHTDPAKTNWITRKMIIHRNLPDGIEFWGDGSNVKAAGQPFTWETSSKLFTVHHFGGVRYPGRLRQSWWLQGRFRAGRSITIKPPQWVFDLFPQKWEDEQFLPYLAIYDGSLVKAVRENPKRFARDNYEMLRVLTERQARTSAPALVGSAA